MDCLYCLKPIDGSFGKSKYVPRGSGGICVDCIGRHWGGITAYRKVHGQVKWKMVKVKK